MKLNICIMGLAAAGLFLCGCKHEEKVIRNVAYNYSYAMANYKVDEAAQYATEETKNTTLVKAKTLVKAVGEEYVKSDTPASIEITHLQIINDTSALAVYHKVTPIKDFSGNLELRKRNGKWLAHTPLLETKEPERPQSHKGLVSFDEVKGNLDTTNMKKNSKPAIKTVEPK